MTKRIIHKFGGSCLREPGDIEKIAEVIRGNHQAILVVSALWGTTDRLYRAAKDPRYASRLVQDLSKQHLRFAPGLDSSKNAHLFSMVLHTLKDTLRLLAQDPHDQSALNNLLASGERLSALVVAHRLQEYGFDAYPLGAEDIGITLDGNYQANHVDLQASSTKLDRETLHGTPVITGWFGEGQNKDIAILSRGGSDHSATAIANLIEADRVILWKDVPGIFRLNPRWGIRSETIPYLDYLEAIELSLMDTPVLHPSTIEPLIEPNIQLEVRHLYHSGDEQKTVVGPRLPEDQLKAVGCLPNVISLGFSHHHVDSHQRQLVKILGELAQNEVHWWGLESRLGDSRLIVSQHDMHRAASIFDRFDIQADHHYHLGLLSLIGCRESDMNEINSLFDSTEYELTWLNQTSSAARVAIDGEDLSEALQMLHAFIQQRIQGKVQQI
ncbi:MAG TPA: aspartate kinase [Candidatus Poseidoniales archaeon]|nr:MAG TPA: aspartate kinase [Candidatus Poseidoniales archaeon]HII24872.1 aspartate kinase [Candidatus Poseidoniaceae archaeon]